MKRLIAFTLAIIICMGILSGCTLKKRLDAYGLYAKAAKDIKDSGGVEAECSLTMDMSILSVTVDMYVKMAGSDYYLKLSMPFLEEEMEMVCVDGYLYTDNGSTKVRTPAPSNDGKSDGILLMPEIAKEIFADVEVVEADDGSKSITSEIDQEVFNKLMAVFSDETGTDPLSEGMSLKNATLTMNFDKNDTVTGMKVSAEAGTSQQGIDFNFPLEVEYKFINLGEKPEISAPEDADDYVTMDSPADSDSSPA